MNSATVRSFCNSLGLSVFVVLAQGCMHTPNSSSDFGDSSEHMANVQTYDPGAASVPAPETLRPVDGAVIGQAVDGYRQAAKPKTDSIQNEIHINVGN